MALPFVVFGEPYLNRCLAGNHFYDKPVIHPLRAPHLIRKQLLLAKLQAEKRGYNPEMELKRIVEDSGDVERGRRLLGNIRVYLYVGVAVFLAVVYGWNHYR